MGGWGVAGGGTGGVGGGVRRRGRVGRGGWEGGWWAVRGVYQLL